MNMRNIWQLEYHSLAKKKGKNYTNLNKIVENGFTAGCLNLYKNQIWSVIEWIQIKSQKSALGLHFYFFSGVAIKNKTFNLWLSSCVQFKYDQFTTLIHHKYCLVFIRLLQSFIIYSTLNIWTYTTDDQHIHWILSGLIFKKTTIRNDWVNLPYELHLPDFISAFISFYK